jgi:hypothetical protein
MSRVETVARAICIAQYRDPDRETFGSMSECGPLKAAWEWDIDTARAVIDAMLVPTAAMVDAAHTNMEIGTSTARIIWDYMIRAADP